MAGYARLLLGLAFVPACWSVVRVLTDAILISTDSEGGVSLEAISLVAGLAAFAFCRVVFPRPQRAYILGHELTHALWGIFFGARPSDLRVTLKGGSVKLTKTNFLITLAPYFFPFYTFLTVLVALGVYAFSRPLPVLPLWMFSVGFTWAFHVVFTIEILLQRQPDVMTYGRVFSWTFIFIVNILVVLIALAVMTPLSFARLQEILIGRLCDTYVTFGRSVWDILTRIRSFC